ncbi:MAG: HD family phosphohydrolase [Anaerolineae bacterium]
MIAYLQQLFETRYSIAPEQLARYVQRGLVTIAGLMFVLVATTIVAFDSIFLQFSNTAIEVGQIATRNIVAPPGGGSYVSEILTRRAREEARNSVQPIYASPELDTTRTWDERAERTLNFINDVRAAGRYDTREQQLADLALMEYLIFNNPDHALDILRLDEDTWNAIVSEVDNVLERVYRTSIRDEQTYISTQLALQISSTFDNRTSAIIFDIVDDFVKPNTFENVQATEEERERVAAAVEPIERNFAGGQIIIGENERIDDLAYEALTYFNLAQPNERTSWRQLSRALIASTITMVILGLYIAHFSPELLYDRFKQLAIVATTFLIFLALAHLLGVKGNIYLFPAAAMALLFVAIADEHVAVISSLALAFLVGLIASDSLEIAVLIAGGSLIGTLVLRRADRLNQFFVAGLLIAIMNAAVVVIFNPLTNTVDGDLLVSLSFAIFSGLLLVPATAIASMYLVTLLFNLPTALKLIDLQQPNKPLLQRLLREAPGTYQHSLQVGNLAEQAANAIGADAQMIHVAALYHDIGKMQNSLYFTENQQDIGNPHDTLNDPYRSAGIIIGHITEGDEMAKQAGLPQRIRDFIREHHGTTQVYVFYQRALKAVDGDKSAVDISDFTYPGPRPRSRETAILMLADSCEAAVRSIKPQSKQEISELVASIIDGKRVDGQLDDSRLTLNDLSTIREIFVDVLQGMFHPRINYREAVNNTSEPVAKPASSVKTETKAVGDESPPVSQSKVDTKEDGKTRSRAVTQTVRAVSEKNKTTTNPTARVTTDETPIADEEPLAEVPRLPSVDQRRATTSIKIPTVDENDRDDAETQNQTETDNGDAQES